MPSPPPDPDRARPETWVVAGPARYRLADVAGRADDLYAVAPTVALVVGTFAAAPYVHLHLEARRRFYPHVPLLVHDDGSHKADELGRLYSAYGAGFERNLPRLPPCRGDLAAFVGGLTSAG